MAQPPDISETFVREVDENLRRDRLRDFVKRYGGWLIGAVVLFLAASGGLHLVAAAPGQQPKQQVEQLAQTYHGHRRRQGQRTRRSSSTNCPKSGSKAVRASAMFARAAVALQQDDTKLAIAKYQRDRGRQRPARSPIATSR